MTIETALGGLSMALFCTITTMIIVGMGIFIGAAIVYYFVKAMDWLDSKMGGE